MASTPFIAVGPNLVATRELSEPRLRVAIVGTREPNDDARAWTRATARRLVQVGAVVVSGGAMGIDAAAHEGALDGEGRTWCVLPCRPGHRYPPDNCALFERIEASHGALIWEANASPHMAKSVFHQRNVQIAALCTHLILVRGGAKSGALGAVRAALKLKRHVYTLDTSPWEMGAEAVRIARRLGAAPLDGFADLETLFGLLPAAPGLDSRSQSGQSGHQLAFSEARPEPQTTWDTADPVQCALAEGALSLDDLLQRTGLSLGGLTMRLLTLVGECVVKDLLSGLYRLVSRR